MPSMYEGVDLTPKTEANLSLPWFVSPLHLTTGDSSSAGQDGRTQLAALSFQRDSGTGNNLAHLPKGLLAQKNKIS